MLSNSSLMKEMIPANDEYVEFEVTDLLRLTLATGESVGFKFNFITVLLMLLSKFKILGNVGV